jgi:phage shock protein A
MALITRVTRLFRSDLNAVLDNIEEPLVLLKQAVREMQESIDADEQRFKLLTHEHGQLLSRQSELEQTFEQIEEELDICFESEKDDLARGLIKRKLETQRLARGLDKKLNTLINTLNELKTRINENKARLTSMQQKADILTEQEVNDYASKSHVEVWDTPDVFVKNEDIEVAFLREQQKRVTS